MSDDSVLRCPDKLYSYKTNLSCADRGIHLTSLNLYPDDSVYITGRHLTLV